MTLAATLVVVLVALLHAWFLVLEMFLWTRPIGLRTFRQSAESAAASRVLAANQGLYNGFLAAGLLYGLIVQSREIVLLFLAFVIVAGLYGGATANRKIFFIQALPAVLAAALVAWH
jgi:putative membrane protein